MRQDPTVGLLPSQHSSAANRSHSTDQLAMNCFTGEQMTRITQLVRQIEQLSDVEKLFLYLQLPSGGGPGGAGQTKLSSGHTSSASSSGASSGSGSGTDGGENRRSTMSSSNNGIGGKPSFEVFAKRPDQETTQTYTWILSHLEVDPSVSLPKQEVYDEYRAYCQANRFEPLCVADFGKAMKHAFPCIKPRRLGQRGNSRYCYSGLRKKYKISPPDLPDLNIEPTFCMANDCSQTFDQIVKGAPNDPSECPIDRHSGELGGHTATTKASAVKPHQGAPIGGSPSYIAIGTSPESYVKNETVQQQQQQPQRPMLPQQPPSIYKGSPGAYHVSPGAHQRQAAPRPATQVQPQSQIPQQAGMVLTGPPPSYLAGAPMYGGFAQAGYPPVADYLRSGTPDDDDYFHNYQDLAPSQAISGNFHYRQVAAMAAPGVASGGGKLGLYLSHGYPSEATDATNTQPAPVAAPGTPPTDGGRLPSPGQALRDPAVVYSTHGGRLVHSQTSVPAATCASQAGAPATSQAAANAAAAAAAAARLPFSNRMELGASPFQSPVATPHPLVSASYLEMPDYYSDLPYP